MYPIVPITTPASVRAKVSVAPDARLQSDLAHQTEVENLDLPVLEQKDVFRLQITVDQPLRVRGGESARDRHRELDRFARRKSSVCRARAVPPPAPRCGARRLALLARAASGGQSIPERLSFEQFRNREELPVMNAGIEDRQDVGVRERSDGLRLPLEASTPIRVGRDRVGQDFDRHIAAEPRVARPVHLAHSAGAEGRDDLVRAKACAGRERQRSQLYGRDALARSQQNVRSRIPLSDGPWHHDGEEAAASVTNLQPLFAVRQAVANDIQLLAHHRAKMFRDMGQLSPQQEETLARATASYLRDALPRGEYLAWVAEDKGTPPTPIGGAGVQLRPILPRPRPGSDDLEVGPEAIVLNVYVEPGWRRRGVGDTLVRAVLNALAERDIRRVVLHASADGRRLYERLGFESTNEMRLVAGSAEPPR